MTKSTLTIGRTSRSRVTNGAQLFLEDVDGRTATARRWRDIYSALRSEVDGHITTTQDLLLRRCATLAVMAEQDEAGLARGERPDRGIYVRSAGILRRLLEQLDLLKPPAIETPSSRLAEIMAGAPARLALLPDDEDEDEDDLDLDDAFEDEDDEDA